jgi:hypothetical protein
VQRRFRIFSQSLQEVRSSNRKGLSYKLGINRTIPGPDHLLIPTVGFRTQPFVALLSCCRLL